MSDDWARVAHASLGISLDAPVGWSTMSPPEFPLQLIAPARHGYRSTVSFSHEAFDPVTPEGLERWLAATAAAQPADYEGFTELDRGSLVVDGRPANAQRYQWEPPRFGRPLEQLLIVVVVAPGLLLEVDSAALPGSDEGVRTVGRMMASLRFDEPAPVAEA